VLHLKHPFLTARKPALRLIPIDASFEASTFSALARNPALTLRFGTVDPQPPESIKRIHVGIEDVKLDRLLEMGAERGLTIEALIQEAIAEFLDERRGAGR